MIIANGRNSLLVRRDPSRFVNRPGSRTLLPRWLNFKQSLYSYSTGYNNTAGKYNPLYFSTTGNRTVATGAYALYSNTTGYENTATGAGALYFSTTGSNNIAQGDHAGYNVTT